MDRDITIVSPDVSKAALASMTAAVTSRGAILKNQEGGIAPNLDLGCDLVRLRVVTGNVHMYFQEGEFCDMTAATRLADQLRPGTRLVRTWSGDQEGVRYSKLASGWSVE